MRAVLAITVMLVACGRVGFDPLGGQGIPTDDYSAAVLEDRPVAYWRLGDPPGSTVARDEMRTYPGTYAGSCQLGTDGIVSGGDPAVQLDGTCRIVIGDVLPFSGTASFTLELWMNPDTVSGLVRWVLDREAAAGPRTGYQIAFQDLELWYERFTDDVSNTYLGTGAPPTIGRFQHVTITHDGAVHRIYVDGAQAGINSTTFSAPATAAMLVLGDNSRTPGKFSGVLDEVAIYDHALDSARVSAHFAAR